MLEDGMRLQIDIFDKDFNIIDKLNDKMVVYRFGEYTTDQLPHLELIAHINALIGQIMSAKTIAPIFDKKESNNDAVTVLEREHCRFDIMLPNSRAEYKEGKLHCSNKMFSQTRVMDALSSVIATLGSSTSRSVNPSKAYVRRLADLHILAIRSPEHTIVIHEDNIHGNMCENVLYDTTTLSLLCFDMHPEEGIVYLYDNTLEPIGSMPYDESYMVYFNSDSIESEE